jgi:hypothetical protein
VVLKEDLLMNKHTIRRARGLHMGSIILTGLSHKGHKFSLSYPEVDGVKICLAHCKCGFEIEVNHFQNYGGIKDLQMKWEKHIGTWNGW